MNVIVEQLGFFGTINEFKEPASTKWIIMERMTYFPISTLYPNSTKVPHTTINNSNIKLALLWSETQLCLCLVVDGGNFNVSSRQRVKFSGLLVTFEDLLVTFA